MAYPPDPVETRGILPSPHSELRERALTWLRGRRSDPGETEDIINGLLEQYEVACRERDEFRDVNHAVRVGPRDDHAR